MVLALVQNTGQKGMTPIYQQHDLWLICHKVHMMTKKFNIIQEGSWGAAPCSDQALPFFEMTLQGSRTQAEQETFHYRYFARGNKTYLLKAIVI